MDEYTWQRIWNDGRDAFNLQIPVTHNPYHHDTQESDAWYGGYEEAYKQKYIMEHSS